MLKDKWKRFAMLEVLSDWSEKVDAVTLFDWIDQTETDDLESLFDDYEIIVWGQFDNLELSDIASHISELAYRAQEYEAMP